MGPGHPPGQVRYPLLLDDGHEAPAPGASELHDAGRPSEQRVVATPADAVPRMDPGSSLTHQDGSGGNGLSGEGLDSKALGLGVSPVAGCGGTLLVSHDETRLPAGSGVGLCGRTGRLDLR